MTTDPTFHPVQVVQCGTWPHRMSVDRMLAGVVRTYTDKGQEGARYWPAVRLVFECLLDTSEILVPTHSQVYGFTVKTIRLSRDLEVDQMERVLACQQGSDALDDEKERLLDVMSSRIHFFESRGISLHKAVWEHLEN